MSKNHRNVIQEWQPRWVQPDGEEPDESGHPAAAAAAAVHRLSHDKFSLQRSFQSSEYSPTFNIARYF